MTTEEQQHAASQWHSPLVLTIIAGIVAVLGNAVVSGINGCSQRQLETQKSEDERILEMLKTANSEKAAENLEFLLKTGLITDADKQKRLQDFLANRKPGSGPLLPIQQPASPADLTIKWREAESVINLFFA